MKPLGYFALCGSLIVCSSQIAVSAPNFSADIAPILESRCLSCHNADEAKGDFVLASKATALGFQEGIIPGNADDSLLIKMVSGPDPEMPKKGKSLSKEEVELLREWIQGGAAWPEDRTLKDNPERDLDWWSLKPLIKDQSPKPGDQNQVDFYVNRKLKEKNLAPLASATPQTLIRRLTYDLTGLPPTPEEIDAFVAKPDWEKLVTRLLASPAFGEKFGQHWLDLARYAETHGYDKDKPRTNAWPYRDYVIRNFNEDKPFTRFVQEQVAGDALFPGDPDGVIALGFLAAGPWDFIGHQEVGEGKIDGRIAKHLDRDEMVSAVFNVFQSTTVQCAQCHHHKFDPIRMEDYYRLHAVFAAVDRADRVYTGLPPDQEKEKSKLQKQVNELQAEQRALDSEMKRKISAKASGIDRRLTKLKEKYGNGLKPQYGYHSLITKNQTEEKWVQVDIGKARGATEVRVIPAFDNYGGIGAGFGFPVRYRVEVSNDEKFSKDVRLLLDATGKDQPNPGTGTAKAEGDGKPFRYLRITATKLGTRTNDYIFALGEVEILNEGGAQNFALNAKVTAKDTIEQGVRWGKSNLVDGIFFRELGNEEAMSELRELQSKRKVIEKELSNPETINRIAKIKEELVPLNEQLKKFPKGEMVYAAAASFTGSGNFRPTGGKPRPIRLLHRGDMTTPGDEMNPGAPPLWDGVPDLFFEQAEWQEQEARAELARYLTRKDNPLFWRTIANRLWQWSMGSPLVNTPNDFGRGGMEPTHPELLDYLAAKLRDDPDQSLKSIVRLLVTSEAYRRSSQHQEANAKIDGNNAYRWRANRRRLSAEEFRDSILAISGKLNTTPGGPSFQDFIIEKPQHSPHYEYHLHDPNDPKSHRRTIYRFVVRSQPQPMLTTLDCADPSISIPERDESTTALQALTQWNHRFVEAMSGNLAERLLDSDEKVNHACQLALGRLPNEEEFAILSDHLKNHGNESFARLTFNLNAFVYVD